MASTVALATTDDLREVLGYQPDDLQRAARLLRMASATVRRYCGRDFSLVEDDEADVEVTTGALRLPNPPIVSVDSIIDPEGDEVDPDAYTASRGGGVDLAFGLRWTSGIYTVTYTHGFDPIPDDVVEVVCSLVELRLSGSTTYSRESLGDWSADYRESPLTGDAQAPVLARLDHYRQLVGRIVTL